ncbi:MAG TPA: DUF1573 domain-containing protein, partial [Flavisolibacter sp.]|nr:DUF1573 domain-containing protein [Flavisolibacter sp.]
TVKKSQIIEGTSLCTPIELFLNTFIKDMKSIFSSILLLGIILNVQGQGAGSVKEKDAHAGHQHATARVASSTSEESLHFKEVEFDFGTIPQGKPVYHSFEVRNDGSAELRIDNVQTTCGCTTPEWKKEPIAKGQSSSIKVGFNAASEGAFEKYITILYNGGATKQVKIKGVVWKAPPTPAPANAPVQFLKQQIQ